MHALIFIGGLVFGSLAGLLIAGLCQMAASGDRRMNNLSRGTNQQDETQDCA